MNTKSISTRKIITGILISLFIFLVTSCSGIIGYSVLLWNESEYNLQDGTIVPVYVKSNISKVYVIGLPGTDEKVEIPIWKLSEPESKSKAKKTAKKYKAYKQKYANCILDGLPIRDSYENLSKQIYRLRKNEVIKILYKGNGVAPTKGGKPLPGEWLRVLTSNGVQGWCFSYNLRTFEMNADGSYESSQTEEVQEKDTLIEQILTTKWYPDYYRSMITKKQINLDYVQQKFGFDTGYESGITSIRLHNVNAFFPYSGIKKTDVKEYEFENAPVKLIVKNAGSIIVKYTDQSGKPKTYSFVTLNKETKIETVIQDEYERRNNLYKVIQNLGPDFRSGNYGTLSFNGNNRFSWEGYKNLIPSVIPKKCGDSGSVSIKYFIPANLKASWDGVLSLKFDNADKELNFLYKVEANGIRLAVAGIKKTTNDETGRNDYQVTQPANSIVLFFQK